MDAPRVTSQMTLSRYGGRVFSAGISAIATLCLVFRSFYLVESDPAQFPGRAVLVVAAGALLLIAGLAMQWPRMQAWGALVVAGYYGIVVIVVLNGPILVANWDHYGVYENLAEQFSMTAAALVVFATARSTQARMSAVRAQHLIRSAQIMFAICAIVFGGAHFKYLDYTWPLVPSWLPPSQHFWAYVTGIAHILAGVALLVRIQSRTAMLLLTIMYASFTPLVHLPMLIHSPDDQFIWSENALNIALTGVAWVMWRSEVCRVAPCADEAAEAGEAP